MRPFICSWPNVEAAVLLNTFGLPCNDGQRPGVLVVNTVRKIRGAKRLHLSKAWSFQFSFYAAERKKAHFQRLPGTPVKDQVFETLFLSTAGGVVKNKFAVLLQDLEGMEFRKMLQGICVQGVWNGQDQCTPRLQQSKGILE